MVQLSTAVGIVVAFAALSTDYVAALSVKSKTASGDGCPAEHWVTAAIAPHNTPDSFLLHVDYPDIGPDVSRDRSAPYAVRSCEVGLELDDLGPLAGQRFAITDATPEGRLFASEGWTVQILSELQYGDGPIAAGRWSSSLSDSEFQGSYFGSPVSVKAKDGTVVWSPCIPKGATLRFSINERWSLLAARRGLLAGINSNRAAWIEGGRSSPGVTYSVVRSSC